MTNDDEELEGLVDRVLEQALLQHRGLEIGPGLLERGHEEIRAGPGHAAEHDGRDRGRDDRRDDADDQPRDGDVGDPDIATDEEQHEQSDDRRR